MLDIGYYTSEALTLLQALIGIPSISREEEAAADFLQNYIEETGIMTGRSGNNIWCISPMFNTQRPTILLNSHIDTVKPVNGWRKQPFTPKMENGKLYGLGSNDAGASLVSLFQAYRYLCATEQNYNLIFLASCEEEVSGKNGIESVLPQLPPITLGVVGEPTEMNPAIAEKGLMVLQIITICYCMKKILTHQYIIERNIIFLKKIKQYIPLNILIQYQASKCPILFFFQSLPAPMLFTPIHILKIQFINFGNIFWQLICIFASQRAICRNRQNDKLCIGK